MISSISGFRMRAPALGRDGRGALALLVGALCLSFAATASGGELLQETFRAKAYDGSRDRDYQIYVPDGITSGRPVPMVMVLHGCRQTQRNMVDETHFRQLADRNGFVVVYPFITSWESSEQRNPNCWGFWFPQHVHEGGGEVEDLHQIALEVESRFAIDPERRYVTGLSSGAAMAIAMAVAHSEYFAAAGAAAGLPYAETDRSVGFVCANPGSFRPISTVVAAMRQEQTEPAEQRTVPVMVVHSVNDCTVNRKGSENIRDAWLARYGADPRPVETTDCSAEGVACAHNKYGAAGRSTVETVFYVGEKGNLFGGGSHYWVGDGSGSFANPNGPSASALFWDFFTRHAFNENQPPSVTIASAAAEGTSITVTGTASDPEGDLAEVTVRLEGRHAQPARAATGTTDWSARFDGLTNNARYTPVATATDAGGATTTQRGDSVAVGEPPAPPTVAITAVEVEASCVGVNGTATAGDPAVPVAAVEVEVEPKGFAPADLAGNAFTFRACGFAPGSHATRARATDSEGASTTVAGADAVVPPPQGVLADWQGHMRAQRIRVYQRPCANVGFGSCDVGFSTIFLTYGFDRFPLYKSPTLDAWYLDPDQASLTH